MPVRTRIAPSPTGLPHVGTAYVALFNLAYTRQKGGEFLLRIEDTDRNRLVPGAEEAIDDSLRWLGLTWDERHRQSDRKDVYGEYAEHLVARGSAYRCWCTPTRLERVRAEQSARKEPPRYDRFCLGKTEAERRREPDCSDVPVIRMQMPDEGVTSFDDLIRGTVSFENALIDDQVLLKSDGFPTYHLAVVVDDHLMGITDVIRGEDWISSTPKHVVLYRMFDWDLPRFAHLSLLRNIDKTRISKRKNPWANLLWFKDQGFLPEALLNFLALMGFSMPDGREVFTFDELVEAFTFDRVSATGPGFDLEKLTWLNGVYVRSLPLDQLVARAEPYLARAGLRIPDPAYLQRVLALEQERIHTLADAPALAGFFFDDEIVYDRAALVPKGLDVAQTIAALEAAGDAFEAAGADADAAVLEERFRGLADSLGLKVGQLFGAIRVAITGTNKAPPLFDTAVTLGYDRVLRRIDAALAVLRNPPD